ncbi:MAG: N-acetylglucosamine kinase [Opitutaceae bacterium]
MGIDGGGSRTRAWVAQVDGRVLGQGSAGGSNVHLLGIEAASQVLVEAAIDAWRDAGLPGDVHDLAAFFAGVAGAGASKDQRALGESLARRFSMPSSACQVNHDLHVALAGALAGAPGAVLVAGTGSACYGRTFSGQSAKSGGWGAVLDDGGSGHWLGIQAMRAIVRATDGRGKQPTFADAIFVQLNVKTPREMLDRLLDRSPDGLDRPAIARLAPIVITAAFCEDVVAGEIVEAGAQELAIMVESVLSRLALDAHPVGRVACAGGLLEHQDFYLERVDEAIRRLVPEIHLEKPGLPPVAGAVLLALELAGRVAGSGVVSRLLDGVEGADAVV